MDRISPQAYRQMRTNILDRYCEQLENQAPQILEHCGQPVLLGHAQRIYLEGGMPLPEDARAKPELIRRIIRAGELFLVHAIEQQMLWMGDFDTERARIDAAAKREFEMWISRFQAWAEV
jgi:hypothetical protein